MKTKNLNAVYYKITGNPYAAMLLQRIEFWCSRLHGGVIINGRKHVANSRNDWAQETGFSIHIVDRMLDRLKKQGLIATSLKKFGGLTQLHTGVTDHFHVAFSAATSGADLPKSGSAGLLKHPPQNCVTGISKVAELHIHGGLLGDTQGETNSPASIEDGMENKIQAGTNSGEESLKENDPMDVKSTLKDAKFSPKLSKDPTGLASVKFIWMKAVAEETGKFAPSIGPKDLAFLKAFLNHCPAGRGSEIVHSVAKEWPHIASEVRIARGLDTIPTEPHLGFMAANAYSFVVATLKLLDGHQQPSQALYGAIQKTQEQHAQGTDETPSYTKKQKMTAAELDAILNDDND